MVGLSVVLENHYNMSTTTNNGGVGGGGGGFDKTKNPQVINKVSVCINNTQNRASSSFLENCFLCNKKLLQGRDIYMYKGDNGFCSEECRSRQIFLDEEEGLKKHKTSSFYSPSCSQDKKGMRNRVGGFAY